MTGWTIHVDAAGTSPATDGDFDEQLGTLMELLVDHGGAVSGGQDHGRYGATFSMNFPTDLPAGADLVEPFEDIAAAAGQWACIHFRTVAEKAGLPAWPIVRLEVLTDDELKADLARPVIPELIGTAELAEILGVSRPRASQVQATAPGFPAPVAMLRSGPVWTRPSINLFLETWARKGGRPRKEAITTSSAT